MAMLELYLIRHGVAEERGKDWPDDSQRPLTADGIARLRKAARGLNAVDVGFDQIVTSPLVRTRQTADVFAEELKDKPPIVTSDALAPAGSPASVIQEITKHVRKARVALVGHEPNLGGPAAQLIGARNPLEFKKGGICRIDFDMLPPKGGGMLRWFLTPKMLRRLGDRRPARGLVTIGVRAGPRVPCRAPPPYRTYGVRRACQSAYRAPRGPARCAPS